MPPELRQALTISQVLTFVMLLRSVAYDRWITVLVAALALAGAAAARRGRVWGVALGALAASWFVSAWAVGIAPSWFALVAAGAALPYLHALRPMARFDARATAFLSAIVASGGFVGAALWKQYALQIFERFPTLMPSVDAGHHGLVAALLAAGVFLAQRRGMPGAASSAGANASASAVTGVRVASGLGHEASAAPALDAGEALEAGWFDEAREPAREARRSG